MTENKNTTFELEVGKTFQELLDQVVLSMD